MNIQKITEYIRSGAKKSENIGLEVEHFIVDNNNNAVSFYGEHGVCSILECISPFFEIKTYSGEYLISLANDDYCLTLEPAAQIEISIKPCKSISEIQHYYNDFLQLISPILLQYEYKLLTLGYQPSDKVDVLPLIPKKRYEFMDDYFKTTGKYGKNMMRGTASAQVSIDYSDEKDCMLKLRLANALSPIFAMITDNSPIFEGKPYNGRMLRTEIWSSVDSKRCGIIPNSMSKNFSFEKYAEYIMNTPAILIEEDDGTIYTDNKKISEIYSGKILTSHEIEHILSMFFPDVRLKTYIEIRPADSMPIEYTLSYAAFVKGIFLQPHSVCKYLNLDNISESDIVSAKQELMRNGFEAVVYGKNINDILDFLLKNIQQSLTADDYEYLTPIKNIIKTKTTLKEGFFNA